MTTNKRRKVTKYRAHTTHGGGHRKKRRGAGNRGGRGRAGSGKRGKARKPSFSKLGKHGFTPRGSISRRKSKENKTINLDKLQVLVQNKKITEKEGVIDLTSMGFQKLLGTGKINLKIQVKVAQCSKRAEEKLKAAGGSIISEKKTKTEVKEVKETNSEE
jgi:large subunit ribosomal protein L15